MRAVLSKLKVFGILLLALPCGQSDAQGVPRTYYVDFKAGSDSAAGDKKEAAWRHAPGDPAATQNPKSIRLSPGDTVVFRAGVDYQGSLQIGVSGTKGHPITYTGKGWGQGRATITGRDAFNVVGRPCASLPSCAKLPNASQLSVIDLPVAATVYTQIVLNGHTLQLSQAPKPRDMFWFDDTSGYARADNDDLVPLPDGRSWTLHSDLINRTLASDQPEDLLVFILGFPNVIANGPVLSYDAQKSSVVFQPLQFRRETRAPVSFALSNHPRLIQGAYEYATVEHGRKLIVYAPPGPERLEISQRAWGVTAVGQKSLAITGFEIEGFADGPQGYGGSALAIRNTEDILFDDNDIHDLENWAGGGAVGGDSISHITITNNRFHQLVHGSGIRIGPGQDLRIANNQFDNIGRTGILIMNSQRSVVDHNTLSRLYGSHGNGISIYLANRDAVISNNTVMNSTRAVTFEGAGRPDPTPNDIVFRNNLFKGSGGTGLQSWGGYTKGVTIEGNVILVENGSQALRLSGRDSNVVVKGNVIDGYQAYPAPLPADTVLTDNIFVSSSRGSTSGNDTKPDLRSAADSFFAPEGRPDERLCKFLVGNRADVAIGASDACKTK